MDDSSIPSRRSDEASLADRLLHRVETAALLGSMLAVVLAAVLIGLSVTGRTFFGRSIPDIVVLTENLMPVIVALPLAFVAARRGHIEVEVFTNWLPPRGIVGLNIFANLIGLVIFGLIAWGAWTVLGRDIETGRFYEGLLRVPAWPAKALFFFGLALFSLRLLLNLFEDIQRLFGRRPVDASRTEG
jgi:TRAP-type C4-dicarboxylate transport system permease small subunit